MHTNEIINEIADLKKENNRLNAMIAVLRVEQNIPTHIKVYPESEGLITHLDLLHQQSDGISPYLECPFCEYADVCGEFSSGPCGGYTQCGNCGAIQETGLFILKYDKDADLYDQEQHRFNFFCTFRSLGYSEFPSFDEEEEYRMKKLAKQFKTDKRFLIYSDQYGVWLGGGMFGNTEHNSPLEQKSTSVPATAPTFANQLEVTNEIQQYGDKFPTYRLVEVFPTRDDKQVTENECANHCLPRWLS